MIDFGHIHKNLFEMLFGKYILYENTLAKKNNFKYFTEIILYFIFEKLVVKIKNS